MRVSVRIGQVLVVLLVGTSALVGSSGPAGATSCVAPADALRMSSSQPGAAVWEGEVLDELPEREGERAWNVRVNRVLSGKVPEYIVVVGAQNKPRPGQGIIAGAGAVSLVPGPILMLDYGSHRLNGVCDVFAQSEIEATRTAWESTLRGAKIPPGERVPAPAPSETPGSAGGEDVGGESDAAPLDGRQLLLVGVVALLLVGGLALGARTRKKHKG